MNGVFANMNSINPVLRYQESKIVQYFAPSKIKPEDEKSDKSTKHPDDTLQISKEAESKYSGENAKELTEEEEKAVADLKKRDKEVRQHEQAHKNAGGSLVRGGASYSYQVGPDGKRYAIGGEVQIDMNEIPDEPKETIQKMQKVKRAATAPAEPSAQDMKVASEASRIEMQARREIAEEQKNTIIDQFA